jgi:hypothetical protein
MLVGKVTCRLSVARDTFNLSAFRAAYRTVLTAGLADIFGRDGKSYHGSGAASDSGSSEVFFADITSRRDVTGATLYP